MIFLLIQPYYSGFAGKCKVYSIIRARQKSSEADYCKSNRLDLYHQWKEGANEGIILVAEGIINEYKFYTSYIESMAEQLKICLFRM